MCAQIFSTKEGVCVYSDRVANISSSVPMYRCVANVHMLLLVGTSVQVALVWLVVVGQLPQFNARML